MHRFTAIAGAFLFTLGCGGGGRTGQDAGTTTGFTNSAVLTGAPVGLDLDLPSEISRVISASVIGEDLSATAAYLGRTSATDNSGTLIVPVTNQGSRRLCFVEATAYELFDTTGASMGAASGKYIRGSVARSATSSIYTNTCVEPGGTSYFLDFISGQAFTTLGSIRIFTASSSNDFLPPQTSVVPISYTVSARDQAYALTIANQGPMTATLFDGEAIYFNDSGVPAYWGTVQVVATSTTSVQVDLAPGATAQMKSNSLLTQWTGNSTTQLVLIDFDVHSSKQGSHPSMAADPDEERAAAARASKRNALRALP